jgi:hypothetical protein
MRMLLLMVESSHTDLMLNDESPRDAPRKRARFDQQVDLTDTASGEHPLRVQPLGQQFVQTSAVRTSRAALGSFAQLDDDGLLVLLAHLDARGLLQLASTTPAMLAFCYDESLWRTLTLDAFEGDWLWRGSWQATFRARAALPPLAASVSAHGLFSDVLFASFLARHAAFDDAWLARESIERRDAATLSVDEFRRAFEAANRPLLITGIPSVARAVQQWHDRSYLLSCFGAQPVHARGTDMPLSEFFAYADANDDEMPLYVFDKAAFDKCPRLAADFDVPAYFSDDCFALLPADVRPSFRWLLIGHRRSGSSWHKDPNYTNAWNATITGTKKWLLLPPNVRPPGVFADRDEVEVTVPLSIVEWFMQFYSECRKLKPIEVVTRPGDVLFVPRGWWHTALNFDYCVAITQNYAPSSSMLGVVDWLEAHPQNASGTRVGGAELAACLRGALHAQRPGLLEQQQAVREQKMFGATQKTFRFGFFGE